MTTSSQDKSPSSPLLVWLFTAVLAVCAIALQIAGSYQ